MYSFTRKIREAYHGRRRNDRPAELRKIREDIDDAAVPSTVSTPSSDGSDANRKQSADAASPLQPTNKPPVYEEPASADSLSEEGAPVPLPQNIEDFPPLPQAVETAATVELARITETAEAQAQADDDALGLEQQAVRDESYVQFNGEETSDYTAGPARIVLACDGVQNCAGLLLTLDFSRWMQKALHAQREYNRMAERERLMYDVHEAYLSKITKKMIDHEYRLNVLHGKILVPGEPEQPGEVATLEAELTKLVLLKEEAKSQRQLAEYQLNSTGDTLLTIQTSVNAYLDEAFCVAKLIGPDEPEEPENPIEELDIDQEYERLCRQLRGHEGEDEGEFEPLHDPGPAWKRKFTPEEQAREDTLEAYLKAENDLQSAQADFDCREQDRAYEWQMNYEAYARGEEAQDAGPEAFDQRWVKRVRELTRTLLDAEEAFGEAKNNAKEAGIDMYSYDQESDFADDVQDGYRSSMEKEVATTAVAEPKIMNWLERVPTDVASPTFNEGVSESGDREAEAKEWQESVEEVGLSDSQSVVAEGFERRKIDKWRQVCGL